MDILDKAIKEVKVFNDRVSNYKKAKEFVFDDDYAAKVKYIDDFLHNSEDINKMSSISKSLRSSIDIYPFELSWRWRKMCNGTKSILAFSSDGIVSVQWNIRGVYFANYISSNTIYAERDFPTTSALRADYSNKYNQAVMLIKYYYEIMPIIKKRFVHEVHKIIRKNDKYINQQLDMLVERLQL